MSEEKRNIDKMLLEMFPSDPEIAECFIGILNVISGPVPPKGPKLTQGYTAEQWQEIIDGGYLCEFSFQVDFEMVTHSLLFRFGRDHEEETDFFHPIADKANDFRYCRPAQIKGVMRPIFAEPVDKSSMLCLFDCEGFPLNNRLSRPSWDGYKDGSGDFYAEATKYIEL